MTGGAARLALAPALALALAIWGGARPAAAGPARVIAGDHGDFTRLAVTFDAPVDWSAGRLTDGYALRIKGQNDGYDLSGVFAKIGRQRLAAIWRDPENGDLILSLGCACHILPFEFRPGVVVIDIREGKAPAGSAFETPLEGAAGGEIAAAPAPRPRARSASSAEVGGAAEASRPLQAGASGDEPERVGAYDWTALPIEPAAPGPETPRPGEPLATAAALGSGLREALLLEMSRGASQGVLQFAEPGSGGEPTAGQKPVTGGNLAIGGPPAEYPVPATADQTEEAKAATAEGKTGSCTAMEELALDEWGNHDLAPGEQLADAAQGLVGEFDRPVADQLKVFVRRQLYLGFGAEARATLAAFPGVIEDPQILFALSHLVEGDVDPGGPFAGQTACQGPSALWALLSLPQDRVPGVLVESGAVILAFSALPTHLRRHLGPVLAEKFLQRNDAASARSIMAATLRAKGENAAAVALMAAEIGLKAGDLAEAEAQLPELSQDSNQDQPETLLALVEIHARTRRPLPLGQAEALEAMLEEQPEERREEFAEGLRLALAAAGEFDRAFALPATGLDRSADLWGLLAHLASDEALLAHAVLPREAAMPAVRADEADLIADRLEGFGLAEEAARWRKIGRGPGAAAAEAEAADEAAATDPPADAPMAEAAAGPEGTADGAAPDPGAEARAGLLAYVSGAGSADAAPGREGPSPAAPAAAGEGQAAAKGPLGQGAAAVAASAAMREQIAALLSAVPKPEAPAP